MMSKSPYEDLFAPLPRPVVKKGEFIVSALRLDHAHITGMCGALRDAGATLKSVYDPDPAKVRDFLRAFPEARPAKSEEAILSDPETHMIASAAVPCERAALGIRVMEHGKDYFTDKAPLTSLEQLESVREACRRTKRRYMCYYSERLHTESGVFADRLIHAGAIGRVVSIQGLGPHRLNAGTRPAWFFEREKYGGILCDIGSHQFEQFLSFADEEDARIDLSRASNTAHPEYPGLEDFGDCMATGKKGTAFYFRVDWFTPDGLREWGDSRTFVVGDKGTIEIRKTLDLAAPEKARDIVLLADAHGETRFETAGRVGYPFFGQLILDSLERTEYAMTQAHCLKAAELCVRAADRSLCSAFKRNPECPVVGCSSPS